MFLSGMERLSAPLGTGHVCSPPSLLRTGELCVSAQPPRPAASSPSLSSHGHFF